MVGLLTLYCGSPGTGTSQMHFFRKAFSVDTVWETNNTCCLVRWDKRSEYGESTGRVREAN